ncbi:PP2C family protein-serine/threonine phosphatase [Paenibacillus sp. UNC451MF]|uniref:PP2C family protein-serine/threonine phosphatase n=1 Tax=Paenibacillus sp. UNC451MF TaxID=1449063 RepID=UPI00048CD2B2|nr:PAS domain S-box protein [Paenibacillus sp. UNC451MF]
MLKEYGAGVCSLLTFYLLFPHWFIRTSLSLDAPFAIKLREGAVLGLWAALFIHFGIAAEWVPEELVRIAGHVFIVLAAVAGGTAASLSAAAVIVFATLIGLGMEAMTLKESILALVIAFSSGWAVKQGWNRAVLFHLLNGYQLILSAMPLMETFGVQSVQSFPFHRVAVSLAGGLIAYASLYTLLRIHGAWCRLTDSEAPFHFLPEAYRSVVEHVREVIFQTDSFGNWRFLNPAWTDMTGFRIEDTLHQGILQYVHPDDQDISQQSLNALLNGISESWRTEIRIITLEGGDCWVELYAEPVRDGGGIVGTLTDITERKRIEQQRRSDMELSKRIQQSVLPKPVQSPFIVIKGLHIPSAQVSGDMYMWALLQEHGARVILMDVMGHGVSSSLMSMYIHAFLQSLPPSLVDPKTIMSRLNARISELVRLEEEGGDAVYCSAVCVRVDALRKRVEYVNAGHLRYHAE